LLIDMLALLPEAQRKHLDPAGPAPARMMAAKGMAPLPPRDMVIVLIGLTADADAKLAEAAVASLKKLPDKILGGVLDGDLPPVALGALAETVRARPALLEKYVLNKQVPDEAIAVVAVDAAEAVAEIISNNQERCLRSEPIVIALRRNTNLLKSSLDRLFDFLVRSGVFYDDMPEVGEALARLSPQEMVEAADKVELPPELGGLLEAETDEIDKRADTTAEVLDSTGMVAEEARARIPMLKLVTTLSVAQKVALAVKGNKEARAILIRDSNRVVASSAIRNPRVTEQEVVTAANSRSVSDEVVRIISGSKELSRAYGVKVALVNNPKTPLPTAMRFLTLLRQSDLKNVAKSKNVSQAVSNQAKRMLDSKN
jgi:hypothetical protein